MLEPQPFTDGRSSGHFSLTMRAAMLAIIVLTNEVRGLLSFKKPRRTNSDMCRDTAFLSYLRLSILMAVVSVAITLSFHLNYQPSHLERKIAKPLGAIFWILALLTLAVGLSNYIRMHTSSSVFYIMILT